MKKILFFIIIIGFMTGIIIWAGMIMAVPIELQIKTTKDNILDTFSYTEKNGMTGILYAYKTDLIKPLPNEVSRTPNAIIQSDGTSYKATIYPSNQFFKDVDGWRQVEFSTTTKAAFDTQTLTLWDKMIGKVYAEQTFFAGAGDGSVALTGQATWAIAHDTVNGSNANATGSSGNFAFASSTASTYSIRRGFRPYDTSAIPNNAIIVSATAWERYQTITDGIDDGNDFVVVLQSSQANSTTLATSDYQKYSTTTEGSARYDITNMTSNAYNSYPLNAAGLSWVKRNGETSNCGVTAGVTCLAFLEGHDVTNTAISTSQANIIVAVNSENAGTSQDPYLSVEYLIPTSDQNLILFQ